MGDSSKSLGFRLENPFALKVGQVFTGVGVGCGIGIGVGRPINFGAIPAVHQILSATRGATDTFSGVGRHVNSSLKKLGVKNIEAGIGCGVGIGHGFGVGLALKPGVVHRIQHSFGVTELFSEFMPPQCSKFVLNNFFNIKVNFGLQQLMEKVMMNLGGVPGMSSVQSLIPGSMQNNLSALSGTSSPNAHLATGSLTNFRNEPTDSAFENSAPHGSSHQEDNRNSYERRTVISEQSTGSRTEKVINNFLQDVAEDNVQVNNAAGKLRIENQVLQMLLKHQQVIEELSKENQKMRQILMEDLKIPPSKLQARSDDYYPCSDCFECRRRKRKAGR